MANSTARVRPAKPYEGFPLFPHATGRWAKKIRDKLQYFGAWEDADAAMQKYLDQRDELHAGRTPRVASDSLTLRDLCNRFLTSKEQQRDAGEIKSTTFGDYYSTCKSVLAFFGKDRLVDDFSVQDFQDLRADFAKRLGPHASSRQVQQVRTLFKFGYDSALLDKPMRFGPAFKRPAKRILRAHRQRNGPRMFKAGEIGKILAAADHTMKAMVLLGINCGFGNNDCGTLSIGAMIVQVSSIVRRLKRC